MPDYYDTLEILPSAAPEVVAAAGRALLAKYGDGREAEGVREALGVLGDEALRAGYDASRNELEGKVIGAYRVEARIAEGGFGKTYRGTHLLTQQPVCIKHCSQISPSAAAILIEEAQAMWDLRHFAIPAVRDVIRLPDGSLAMVMSYIPGPTLHEIIEAYAARGERLEPENVAWIMERVVNALSYMHRHGVVHGDIKPRNIIVQPESHTVVLVDFGLASVRPRSGDNAKGFTDLFAPPEQRRGEPLLPQSDFYSLGRTALFTLNAGNRDRVESGELPADVPDAMCYFLRRLVMPEVLRRPDWRGGSYMAPIRQMRQEAFGRSASGMIDIRMR